MECKLIADAALLCGDSILMVKYSAMQDRQNGWFLPDDLLEHLEHPQDAAQRLLREQLGLDKVALQLSHIESFPGRDKSWHLAFHYRGDLDEKPKLAPSDRIAETSWFDLNRLPDRSDVAHHGWALDVIGQMLAGARA